MALRHAEGFGRFVSLGDTNSPSPLHYVADRLRTSESTVAATTSTTPVAMN